MTINLKINKFGFASSFEKNSFLLQNISISYSIRNIKEILYSDYSFPNPNQFNIVFEDNIKKDNESLSDLLTKQHLKSKEIIFYAENKYINENEIDFIKCKFNISINNKEFYVDVEFKKEVTVKEIINKLRLNFNNQQLRLTNEKGNSLNDEKIFVDYVNTLQDGILDNKTFIVMTPYIVSSNNKKLNITEIKKHTFIKSFLKKLEILQKEKSEIPINENELHVNLDIYKEINHNKINNQYNIINQYENEYYKDIMKINLEKDDLLKKIHEYNNFQLNNNPRLEFAKEILFNFDLYKKNFLNEINEKTMEVVERRNNIDEDENNILIKDEVSKENEEIDIININDTDDNENEEEIQNKIQNNENISNINDESEKNSYHIDINEIKMNTIEENDDFNIEVLFEDAFDTNNKSPNKKIEFLKAINNLPIKNEKVINLVLDIDHTLLYAERTDKDSYEKSLLNGNSLNYIKFTYLNQNSYFKITYREDLLRMIFEIKDYIKNIYISTAGVKEYAESIINNLIKKFNYQIRFNQILSATENSLFSLETKQLIYKKELSIFNDWKNHIESNRNSIIIDDTSAIWIDNKDKYCILPSFKFINKKKDKMNRPFFDNMKELIVGVSIDDDELNKIIEYPLVYYNNENIKKLYLDDYFSNPYQLPPHIECRESIIKQSIYWKDIIILTVKFLQYFNLEDKATAEIIYLLRNIVFANLYISLDFVKCLSGVKDHYLYKIIESYGGKVVHFRDDQLTHIIFNNYTYNKVRELAFNYKRTGKEVFYVNSHWIIKSVYCFKRLNELEAEFINII